uniref:Spermatogenesis associated 2 like n=1 Tax=Pelusios castaneus TaxID=367368 RepID=A0A8C8VK11_9SAUR
MGPSAVVRQYGRCLETDLRRGHCGVCTDLALRESLRQHLLKEPELHCTLQNDVFATLARSLQGRDDLLLALRGLARAFEVLELAAVNLHLFPWRKEFSTIKTFSGGYVHSLQAVLSDTDIAKSFHRLGYVKRDDHHLVVSHLPLGAELIHAACGFFAARVECEILGEILQRLGPCRVSAEDLIQVRRGTRDLGDCVEKLQRRARWRKAREPEAEAPPDCANSVDLYRDVLESPDPVNLYSDPWGSPYPGLHRPPSGEHSSQQWSEAVSVPWSEDLRGNEGRLWDNLGADEPSQEQPYRNGTDPEITSFSFISLHQELSRVSDSFCPEVVENPPRSSPSNSATLKPHGGTNQLVPHFSGEAVPSSVRLGAAEQPTGVVPAAPWLESSKREVPEPPRYQLHECLSRGALPSYCCSTCCLLHASGCEAMQTCGNSHCMQELRSETQKRLWLQRIEVDMLLNAGSGPSPSYGRWGTCQPPTSGGSIHCTMSPCSVLEGAPGGGAAALPAPFPNTALPWGDGPQALR